MKCWVCGDEARTGEHMIKKSDLSAVFGHVCQNRPLYRNSASRRNVPVKGLNVDLMKSRGLLCARCNNQRTQAFDRAWQRFSAALRSRPVLRPGDRIDLGKIFPGDVRKSMLNVHLYFVKLFGCLIAEKALPIDIHGFSHAILSESAHPKVYLAISPFTDGLPFASVGYSDLDTAQLNGIIVYATWLYILDRFTVRIMYADPSERRRGLIDSWQPSTITKCLRVSKI